MDDHPRMIGWRAQLFLNRYDRYDIVVGRTQCPAMDDILPRQL